MNGRTTNATQPAKRILVIDDEDEQEFLLMAFEEESPGQNITCMNDGRSGVVYLQQLADDELPSLIVLDYNLPGPNGADVLRRLRQMPRFKNIPVVIYSTSGNLHSATATGAVAFVAKACSWQGIRENVRAFLFYERANGAVRE